MSAVFDFTMSKRKRCGRLPKYLMLYIDPAPWGHVAEWLRNGLQNRVHQFNSGRGLHPILLIFPNNLIPFLFRKSGLLPLCYLSSFLAAADCKAASTSAAASSCIPGITWL